MTTPEQPASQNAPPHTSPTPTASVTGTPDSETMDAAITDPEPTAAPEATPPKTWKRVAWYGASLPERSTRAAAALLGGVVKETADVALPDAVRGSRLYRATIDRLLRIVVELAGDVRGEYPAEAIPIGQLATRKAIGNVVELASIFAAGFSPVWVLAAISDVAGGSKVYLQELVRELQSDKLLPADVAVSSVDELLGRLETSSGVLADAVDLPPLQLADARASLETLRAQGENLPDATELSTLWSELQRTAREQDVPVMRLSAAVGLAAARAGLELGDTHVLGFYQDSLGAIQREGLLTYLRRTATPYLRRAGQHYLPGETSYTERALGWLNGRWSR